MSGWADSNRRAELPDDWPQRVSATKRRAKGKCEWILDGGRRCPRFGTDCDHKNGKDDHRLSNLQWLCPTHHQKKTQTEALAGRMAKRTPKRPEERHPGLR